MAVNRNRIRRSRQDYFIDIVNTLMLIVIAFVTLYPFYYILVLSFNEGNDAIRGGIYFWPRTFTLENYRQFFTDSKWTNALFITVLRTVSGTLMSVIFTCIVAYGLSFKDLIGRKTYFLILIIAMYFSGGLIPYYILLRELDLLNKFGVYIIPGMLNIFFVMIATTFFGDIPREMLESAHIDGASEMQTFLRIVLPISLPLIATMTLFIGVGHWNSWIDSAYYVRADGLRTLSYRMMEVINQSMKPTTTDATTLAYAADAAKATTQSLQMAAMIVALGPIMCVYPFLQKYFASGIMLGAVKG